MKNKALSFFIALSLIFSLFGVSTLLSSCPESSSGLALLVSAPMKRGQALEDLQAH